MSLLREARSCVANQTTYRSLNAFIRLADASKVCHEADEADKRSPPKDEPLYGRLIAIKDNITTSSSHPNFPALPTTAASHILADFTSPYDASVVGRLKRAGAIIAGKTNLDEFGMGSHSTHSHFNAVQSPFTRDGHALSAGGSSGGSAVAVATGQCWAALGTDTGGSVRLPAAYTGTVGFKPSYGLLSRWGVIAYANSLDTVGILARNTTDARAVFAALAGFDGRDPTSLPPSTRARIAALVGSPRMRERRTRLRIGVPGEYNIAELTLSVRTAWSRTLSQLRQRGHSVVPVSLPTTKHALSAYYVLAPAEASSNLAKYDGVRYGFHSDGTDGGQTRGAVASALFTATRAAFGAEVRRRILLGAYTLSADAIDNYFVQAQRIRRLVQRDFDGVFALPNPLTCAAAPASAVQDGRALESSAAQDGRLVGVDVLLTPTAPTPPPTLAAVATQTSVEAYMNDVLTVPASLAGLPACSVPAPSAPGQGDREVEQGVGMQVVGQFGDDGLVLDVAAAVEELARG
ncbi:Glutamyl-tRNA amidotransferase subunit A, mitochondrial [Cryomyces antarcticus]